MWTISLKEGYKLTNKASIYFKDRTSLPLTEKEVKKIMKSCSLYKIGFKLYDNSDKVVASLTFDETLVKEEVKKEVTHIPMLTAVKFKTKEVPKDLITLKESEINLIKKALEFTNNNKTLSAKILGIATRTLRYKIRDYKIDTLS